MKKKILYLTLLIYTACLMQSTVSDYIEIAGIKPNLLLVVAISIALIRKDMEAAFMGLTLGLAMDVLVGRTLGWYALCLFLICFPIGLINQKLYKENPLIPISFVFFSSIAVETLYYMINFFLRGYQDIAFMFTRIIIPESIYNAAMTLIVYPVVLIVYRKLDKFDHVHTRL